MAVVEVDGEDEFEEEVDKVVKNFPVLFGRRWQRGFNRGCCRSHLSNTRSSHSGSWSRRAPGCGTVCRGICVFGFGNGVCFFVVVVRQLGKEGVYLSWTVSSVLGA